MNARYYGPITATIDHQARRVVFSVKRDRRKSTQLLTGEMSNVAAWALAGVSVFERQGYDIDRSGLSKND